MNKKQVFILVVLCANALIAYEEIKEAALLVLFFILIALFLGLVLIANQSVLKLAKILLAGYAFLLTFFSSMIGLYRLFPDAPQLEPVQDYGGIKTVVALLFGLVFSLFLLLENRKEMDKKIILMDIGGLIVCIIPYVLIPIL